MNKTIHTPNLSRVTAILCAIVALLSLIAFFTGNATQPIRHLNNRIDSVKEDIAYNEDRIVSLETDIVLYQKNLADAEAALPAVKAELDKANSDLSAAQSAYKAAQTALDAVCYRYYYSSYSCTEECKPLHEAEDAQYDLVGKAEDVVETCANKVTTAENNISAIKNQITEAEQNIVQAQNSIEALKDNLSKLRSDLASAWFGLFVDIIAISAVVGSLVLFTKSFFCTAIDKLCLFACGGLAAASTLYLFFGLVKGDFTFWAMFIHPHAFNIVIMACFAGTMTGYGMSPVKLRTFAIVAAVILAVLGVGTGNALVALVYAAAMICASFLFVPLVYTEYIPMAKHIFLSLITCGIWVLVWIYQVTKLLNKVDAAEERRPGAELALCMFLPFYSLYWLLKTAENVELYGAEKEKVIKLDVLCVAFGLICPLFATVLIQNKINLIAGKPAPAVEEAAEAVEAE